MIDRNEFAQEVMLRENIRKAIKIVKGRRKTRRRGELYNEEKLRNIVRGLLKEAQSAVADVAKHDSTGINALEDLLKNTNVLSVLETGYKSLTTRTKDDPAEGQTKQRLSYENHILRAVETSLAPEESRKGAGEDVEITEEVDISIAGDPTDDPDFIDVEEKEEVEETEEVEASKEEVQFVSVEQFNTTIDELKALITELKGNTELSEEEIKEETTELSEEVKEEVQEVELATAKEEVAEPIKHNPENNEKVNVGRKISPKKQNTIMDSVFSKISNNNNK